MPLPISATLGAYEIVAPLGAGGMGEVYRARDTQLGREVALKILPDAFAVDAERVARFEREARTLAALNHPNIAQIYGAGRLRAHSASASAEATADKSPRQGGEVIHLVMELVPGEDLATRISRGAAGADEAIALARQMAAALEAAHESGVIHRDFKPANVRVREDGTVKVLDFGLAKALDPADPASGVLGGTAAPTVTSPATAIGTILGTAAYMSPEQARGRPVDKRADIWAFGVVVFELLTGSRLFSGETVSDTLAAVLRQDIPWSSLPADTPPFLRRLLTRCLERDAKRRLRDIGEARLALEPGADLAIDAAVAPPVAAASLPRWRTPLIALASLLLGAVATAALWPRPPAPPPPIVMRSVLPLDDAGAVSGQLRMTSDGRHVVFTAMRDGVRRIVVRPIDRLEVRAIPGTDGAEGVFLSPDDRWVAFFANERLKRVPLAGGNVEDLAPVPRNSFVSGTWTNKREMVVVGGRSTLSRIPEHGGTPTAIVPESAADTGRGIWPLVTPDDRFVIFQKGGPLGEEDDYLAVISLETGEQFVTTIAAREPVALVQGHLLFRRPGGALMAVRFDAATGRFRGEPFQVLEPSDRVAVSAAGHAVYMTNEQLRNVVLRDGTKSELYWTAPWPIQSPRLAPRGNMLAFERRPEREVWVYDHASGTTTRLAEQSGMPAWSHDGTRVVYSRLSPGMQPTREIFWRPVDASTSEARIFRSETLRISQAHVAPDGKRVLLTAAGLWLAPIGDGAAQPTALVQDEPDLAHARISPDGRWVAYAATVSGRRDVYLRPFPGAGGRVTISTDSHSPLWSPDSRALYYRQGDTLVRAVFEFTPTTRVISRTVVLTGGFGSGTRVDYDVMPDGRLLVLEAAPDSSRMVVVTNFLAEFLAR